MFLIDAIIDIYLTMLFLRIFMTPRDLYYSALLQLVYNATEPILGPLREMLKDLKKESSIPLIAILIILVLRGLLFGSILRSFQGYGDYLFQVYIVIILATTLVEESYTNLILEFASRMIQPVHAISRGIVPSKRGTIMVSALLLVAVHMAVTFLLVASQSFDARTVLNPFLFISLLRYSLGLILDLTTFFTYIIIISALLSWVSTDPSNPVVQFIYGLVSPILRPLRKIVPLVGPIDISPIVAIFLLQIINQIGRQIL